MKKPHIWKIKESPWWCCDGVTGASPKAAYYEWAALWLRDEVVEPLINAATNATPEPFGVPEMRRVASFEG